MSRIVDDNTSDIENGGLVVVLESGLIKTLDECTTDVSHCGGVAREMVSKRFTALGILSKNQRDAIRRLDTKNFGDDRGSLLTFIVFVSGSWSLRSAQQTFQNIGERALIVEESDTKTGSRRGMLDDDAQAASRQGGDLSLMRSVEASKMTITERLQERDEEMRVS